MLGKVNYKDQWEVWIGLRYYIDEPQLRNTAQPLMNGRDSDLSLSIIFSSFGSYKFSEKV